MMALSRHGELCHSTTAARESAFDSPMLLVGGLVVGTARVGELLTIHGHALLASSAP